MYATFNTVERETAKAVLHSVFGWVPKSQVVAVIKTPMGEMMVVKAWMKSKLSRSDYLYGRRAWWPMSEKELAEALNNQ